MPENLFSIEIAAPQKKVWEIMTDHERYVKWSPAKNVTYAREGSPEKNGLGAIRVFHTMLPDKMNPREEVIGWDPPRSMTYRILNQAPMKNYESTMSLAFDETSSTTRLTWKSRWEDGLPKWIGWAAAGLMTKITKRALKKFAKGIKKDAEAAS